jgi:protein-L-isoaspartate(D-aspartate) O-methyltransferase
MTTKEFSEQRRAMVERQITARGVRAPAVLRAMGKVRREGYVPSYLGEFAYEDTPLPIEEEQTISQPYIVAFMVEALDLRGGEKVLEIGTGSGYAAAVLAEIAGQVYTIERHARLAESAAAQLRRDGYDNVHVRCGDGTRGWPENAPFDAIVVAAGGPEVPPSLREQLAVGGKLVVPVGETVGLQKLVRVSRISESRYEEEELGDVRFVPLVGAEGWHEEEPAEGEGPKPPAVVDAIHRCAEPFDEIDSANLDALLDRIGDARVVLLGESSHGTSEFYRMRARITEELVKRKGFRIVAVEADWPDAASYDQWVRRGVPPDGERKPFARFPTWMWRNVEVGDFLERLREYNLARPDAERVRFAGLDLYGLYNSIAQVLEYLDDVDAETAAVARQRYGCLTPWQSDPAAYGKAAITGAYRSCEGDVVAMLDRLLSERLSGAGLGDERLFEAIQNARLIANAEMYYRIMYYGAAESWNLRDRHMFDTLELLLEFHGPDSKAVVWEHNSHVGDASATEMSARGELNVGQLCRERFGDRAYSIGFGTDRGTVAAASYWDGPMEIKKVRPALPGSYEDVMGQTGTPSFLLPLRRPREMKLRDMLADARLERAIGVIYRPETERASHYFHAVLPAQFDEWIWIEETHAVRPLEAAQGGGARDTYPSGL